MRIVQSINATTTYVGFLLMIYIVPHPPYRKILLNKTVCIIFLVFQDDLLLFIVFTQSSFISLHMLSTFFLLLYIQFIYFVYQLEKVLHSISTD